MVKCNVFLFVAMGFGFLLPSLDVQAQRKYSLKEMNASGRIVCKWKKGTADIAVKGIKDAGLKIVHRPPNIPFATCVWDGKLTEEQIKKLKSLEGNPIILIEPGADITLAEDPRSSRPKITSELLNAYEFAGRMVCVWAENKRQEAVSLVRDLGLKIVHAPPNIPMITCRWQSPLTKETLEKLMSSPALVYVEPGLEITRDHAIKGRIIAYVNGTPRTISLEGRLATVPDDPSISKQWGMTKIKAPHAWTCANSTDVIVAVIDTGIDYYHPDLKANMWVNTGEIPNNGVDDDKNGFTDDVYGHNQTVLGMAGEPTGDPIDGHGHGTHVAGIIGAVGNNKVGVTGVNWRVKLMAIKIFDDNGKAPYDTALPSALKYAIDNNVKVINLSLKWNSERAYLKQYIDEAERKGILVVCAAGNLNSGDDPKTINNDVIPQYPASFANSNIISVANVTENDELNQTSHFGATSVDLGAPGTDVYSTYPVAKGSYESLTGTSMAAPHVAGAAALIWGQPRYRNENFQVIRKLIENNVRSLPSLQGKCVTGGTLNIAFLCDKTQDCTCPPPPRCCAPCHRRGHLFFRLRYRIHRRRR